MLYLSFFECLTYIMSLRLIDVLVHGRIPFFYMLEYYSIEKCIPHFLIHSFVDEL